MSPKVIIDIAVWLLCTKGGLAWMFVSPLFPMTPWALGFLAILFFSFRSSKTMGKKPFSDQEPTWKWAFVNAFLVYYVVGVILQLLFRFTVCSANEMMGPSGMSPAMYARV
jgi:hypothetical protein